MTIKEIPLAWFNDPGRGWERTTHVGTDAEAHHWMERVDLLPHASGEEYALVHVDGGWIVARRYPAAPDDQYVAGFIARDDRRRGIK